MRKASFGAREATVASLQDAVESGELSRRSHCILLSHKTSRNATAAAPQCCHFGRACWFGHKLHDSSGICGQVAQGRLLSVVGETSLHAPCY